MRLRNVPGAREEIADNEFVIHNPEAQKGRWQQFFGSHHPIHLEIGMGKGQFLAAMAQKYPDVNFIGIEKYSSVLLRALEKQRELMLPNLYFIRMDAVEITEVFGSREIEKIYLNFSDPWPKDRHAKRRLMSRQFLERYDAFLHSHGQVEFKTDNTDLFEFALEETPAAGWIVEKSTYDLHHSPYAEENVMTEYEEKFSKHGSLIHWMRICRN